MADLQLPDRDTFHRTLAEIASDPALDDLIGGAVEAFDLQRCVLPNGGDYDGAEFKAAVALSIATLRMISRPTDNGASAYYWTQQAEALAGMFGEERYVSNAAMIVAAHIQAVPVFEFVVKPATGSRLAPLASLRVGPVRGWRGRRS